MPNDICQQISDAYAHMSENICPSCNNFDFDTELCFSCRAKEKHRKDAERELLALMPELKRQHEAGLIVGLPCEVGTDAYRIVKLYNGDYIVAKGWILQYSMDKSGIGFYFQGKDDMHSIWCHINNFGKTVFLTEQEAIKVLEGK